MRETRAMQFLLDEDTFVDKIDHETRLDVAKKLADILDQFTSLLINAYQHP